MRNLIKCEAQSTHLRNKTRHQNVEWKSLKTSMMRLSRIEMTCWRRTNDAKCLMILMARSHISKVLSAWKQKNRTNNEINIRTTTTLDSRTHMTFDMETLMAWNLEKQIQGLELQVPSKPLIKIPILWKGKVKGILPMVVCQKQDLVGMECHR